MKKTWFDYIFLVLRIALGVVFIYASLYKIRAPGDFAHEIFNYHLLPPWSINPLANVLPWLQLVCGLALFWRPLASGASLWAVIMMVVFQLAVASALMRGLNISCGCFKAGGQSATWMTFARDSAIFIVALLVAWNLNRRGRYENR